MLAAWFNLRARDPYPNGGGPDGLSGVISEPENLGLYNEHLELFKEMNRVVQSGGIQTAAGKPKIHCGDDWAILQDPETDQLRSSSGELRFNDDKSPMLIKQDPELHKELYNADESRNGDTISWMPDTNTYLIEGSRISCERFGTFAFVTAVLGKVTICPATFDPLNDDIPNEKLPTAESIAALTPINMYLPASQILLHETVHLVLGQDRSTLPESCA
ncbi:hypothetical protein TWF696_005681 [Orbilia brochopaga]|uniref:Uncharacterized protein n=1 Tax=Orbilia brochopaga TaxID=3140254 RepID=A0AAV9UX06_9PEZI